MGMPGVFCYLRMVAFAPDPSPQLAPALRSSPCCPGLLLSAPAIGSNTALCTPLPFFCCLSYFGFVTFGCRVSTPWFFDRCVPDKHFSSPALLGPAVPGALPRMTFLEFFFFSSRENFPSRLISRPCLQQGEVHGLTRFLLL